MTLFDQLVKAAIVREDEMDAASGRAREWRPVTVDRTDGDAMVADIVLRGAIASAVGMRKQMKIIKIETDAEIKSVMAEDPRKVPAITNLHVAEARSAAIQKQEGAATDKGERVAKDDAGTKA